MSQYYCKNCNASIKSTDVYCNSCGKKLSDVGRAIKVEFVETISLSDNAGLSNRISGSMTSISGDIVATSSFINAIPEKKLEEIGIDEKFVVDFKKLEKMFQYVVKKQPFVEIEGSVINAPITVSKEGNNIVITTDIGESFNRLYQEIDKMDNPEIKTQAKSKAQELQEETMKEKPDLPKVRKLLSDLKTYAPLALSIAQLAVIIGKLLVGG